MYAIVEIAGHQYKVQKDQQIFVNRLHEEEGSKIQFDEVLLIDNAGKITVGAPVISGAAVTAKVDRHLKGDKVIIFKKKRRKGYQKKNGFRAYLTEISIEGIIESGAKKSAKKAKKEEIPEKEAEVKAPVAKKAAPKKEAKAEAPKKETKAAPKKAAPKKAAKGDDLKKIEGVGPKIAEILAEAGLDSYANLAASSADAIREILATAGNRYKSHDPETWTEQAQMAADGKWDELKEWQDKLDGGRN